MAFTLTHLSQRDPRWSSQTLGLDNTVTIGADGCALTCLAMLVNGYGLSETPTTINQKLQAMGSGTGFIGAMIVWGALTRAFPSIVYQRVIVCQNQPAPLTDINTSLAAGQPVVVQIDRSPLPGPSTHWVVLYAQQGNDYLMLDPWPSPPDSQPVTLMSRYSLGRPIQNVITAAVWYLAQAQGPGSSLPPSGPGFYVQVPPGLASGLNLHSAPSTTAGIITLEGAGTWLQVLDSEASAQAKIGIQDQWLNVKDPQANSGYVAAWYVQGSGLPAPAPAPAPSTGPALTVYVSADAGTTGLHLRDQPSLSGNQLAAEAVGGALTVLEPSSSAQLKIGVYGQWLNVKDAQGNTGYVAAWYVQASPAAAPAPAPQPPAAPTSGQTAGPLSVIVSASVGPNGLRLRDQPSLSGNQVTMESAGTRLTVLEDASQARAKVGVQNQWLNVQDASGKSGYVAAWYVELPAPQAGGTPVGPMIVTVSSQASAGLRLRVQPNSTADTVITLAPGTQLTVLETAAQASAKVGVQNQWLNVKDPQGNVGYVAAWYVQR
jgi:SH3-like domain-containing protein